MVTALSNPIANRIYFHGVTNDCSVQLMIPHNCKLEVLPVNEKTVYRRNLPHIQPNDGVFFITFRLYGSLPSEVMRNLQIQRDLEINQLRMKGVSSAKIKEELKRLKKLYFGKFDQLLDNPKTGPKWLKDSRIAGVVQDTIHYLSQKDYELICYCIMANHVHLMIQEIQRPLFKILQSLKRHSSREANKILNRSAPFWQKESYDNLVRDDEDLQIKINYTLDNPVKVGLTPHWRQWDFSYLNPEFKCTC